MVIMVAMELATGILATTAATESNNQRGVDMAWAAFRSAARTAEGVHFPEAVRMVVGQVSHSILDDRYWSIELLRALPFGRSLRLRAVWNRLVHWAARSEVRTL
jgi:hypothetical protein